MKVLVDLRPAFAGHAGIPQETRLLFAGLRQLDGLEVDGLLQSSNRVLPPGLSDEGVTRLDPAARFDASHQVAAALAAPEGNRAGRLARAASAWLAALARAATGRALPLGRFDAQGFEGELWRALFERTLAAAERERVVHAGYRVMRLPWSAAHAGALLTMRLGCAFYPRLDTRGFDVLIAQTPAPLRVGGNTRLVVRYHDTVPLRMAGTTRWPAYDRAIHRSALERNRGDGAWFACVSEATRRDLVALLPQLEPRTVTIPNLLSPHYVADDVPRIRVGPILRARAQFPTTPGDVHPASSGGVSLCGAAEAMAPYLLMVSTLEPRKNHLVLLQAWERLRATMATALHLVLVGSLGWQHELLVSRLRGPWRQGTLHLLGNVPAEELRVLYRYAAVTVCPSLGEGFGYSGVEAMACGGIVVASDIAAHREIYGDAADFFDPTSDEALAAAVRPWLDLEPGLRRAERVRAGRRVADRYRPPAVLPRWDGFLRRLTEARVRP